MTEEGAPAMDQTYAGWAPAPEIQKPSPRARAATLWLSIGAGVAAFGYGLAYLQDADGRDGLWTLVRLVAGLLGAALLTVAWVVARRDASLIRGLLRLGITLLGMGVVDAAIVFADLALGIPSAARLLAFLFMSLVVATQLLLLVRRGGDEGSLREFFARHSMVLAFLLFLLVTRIAFKDALKTLFPALVTNLLYLVAFLGAAVYLIGRFLAKFGSPVSWGEARRHEQNIERLSDARMEEVRKLLSNYVQSNLRYDEYQAMVRVMVERLETTPDIVEPLLRKPPAPLRPELPTIRTGPLLGSSFLLSVATGILLGALVAQQGGRGAWLIGAAVGTLAQPMASLFIRANTPDPAPVTQWTIVAFAGLALAAAFYLAGTGGLPFAVASGALGIIYAIQAATRLLKRRQPARPDRSARRAEAADIEQRRARSMMYFGGAVALATPLWAFASWAARTYVRLGYPPATLVGAAVLAGFLIVGAGLIVGPGLAPHREEIRKIHAQEVSLRQAFHKVIVKKLEGART